MNLRPDNPYVTGFILDFGDDMPILERRQINYPGSVDDEFHIVKVDETLMDIAGLKYQNSKLWWLIADANDITDPFTLEIGKALTIPDFATIKALYL